MKYFLHDSNAFNDEKVTELFMSFGYEGLGLFYTLLEKLAFHEKPIKTNVLKTQLKVGKKLEKCWKFMEKIELISSNNGETFNKQLINFSGKYAIKKEKNAKRISEWRKNQIDTENVTCYEHICSTDKVNKSKVNRSKDNKDKSEIPIFAIDNKFKIPSILEIQDYCLERKNNVDPETFFNFYETKGWMVGKNKMKNWKSCVITWEKSNNNGTNNKRISLPSEAEFISAIEQGYRNAAQ